MLCIRKSNGMGNPRDGHITVFHQIFGAFHLELCNILMGRKTELLFENANEVGSVKMKHSGKVCDGRRRRKMILQVTGCFEYAGRSILRVERMRNAGFLKIIGNQLKTAGLQSHKVGNILILAGIKNRVEK